MVDSCQRLNNTNRLRPSSEDRLPPLLLFLVLILEAFVNTTAFVVNLDELIIVKKIICLIE